MKTTDDITQGLLEDTQQLLRDTEALHSRAIREKLQEMLITLEYMTSNDLTSSTMTRYYIVQAIKLLERASTSL